MDSPIYYYSSHSNSKDVFFLFRLNSNFPLELKRNSLLKENTLESEAGKTNPTKMVILATPGMSRQSTPQ